jgi:hypothetical protein
MSTGSRVGLSAGPEEISAELEAMQAIGLAFSQLQDPMARARVLRWATARFEIPVETPPGPVSVKAARVAESPMDLTLDGVDEMFDPPAVTLEGVQEMFDPWAVTLRPANLHLEDTEPPHVSRDTAHLQNIHCEGADSEPLDSLMRALATDFQRFAVDLQRA